LQENTVSVKRTDQTDATPMKDRTDKRWTERQKEWLGYRRKIANLKKSSVSLSKPPWDKKPEKIKENKEKN